MTYKINTTNTNSSPLKNMYTKCLQKYTVGHDMRIHSVLQKSCAAMLYQSQIDFSHCYLYTTSQCSIRSLRNMFSSFHRSLKKQLITMFKLKDDQFQGPEVCHFQSINQSINQSIEFCNLRANLLGLAGQ